MKLDLVKKAEMVEQGFKHDLNQINNGDDLEAVRLKYSGRSGKLPELMSLLKTLSSDEKKEAGPLLNVLRQRILAELEGAKGLLKAKKAAASDAVSKTFDVTGYQPITAPAGSRHLYAKFIEEIEEIFISMGLSVFDGPELVTDFYNFGALNIPDSHPARDMYDTFWLEKDRLLLRTHTSSVQIHAIEKYGVPIAGIAPGRVYRYEATDATHDAMFTQCEGLVIDKNINMSHLSGVFKSFLQQLFNTKDIDIRMRPGFFPFVEPGVEIDMRCIFCKDGCRICSKTTWIELCGAGMVHPNVLKAVNVDSSVYSGFAFGCGIERLAMLRYGIDDIRLFHSGKMPFLRQFR